MAIDEDNEKAVTDVLSAAFESGAEQGKKQREKGLMEARRFFFIEFKKF